MQCTIAELRCREVINIRDGCRIGFVNDLEIDIVVGKVVALVIPGPPRFFGLFGRQDDYLVPWDCIRRIGDDIILVDIDRDKCRTPRSKGGFFF